MVVGRRRVAAASVATAYALHVYVLPNTIFDRPKPAIPPPLIPGSPPGCRKVGVRRACCSGYFSRECWRWCWCWCWLGVPRNPFYLSIHQFHHDPSKPFQTLPNPPSRRYTYSIYTLRVCSSLLFLALPCSYERRDAPGVEPPLLLHWFIPVYPSIARVLFLFLRLAPSLSLSSQARFFSLAMPYTRIQVVDIVLRSVSKLRENDRPASHVVSASYVCIQGGPERSPARL